MEHGQWVEDDWYALIHALKYKECILILGPDASVEDVGGQAHPLTELLANELSKRIEHQELTSWGIDPSDLVQVAQHYDLKKRKRTLHANIDAFYSERWELTSQFHRDVAVLPLYLVITSTPDNMLYNALKEQGKEPILERYNFQGENPKCLETLGTVDTPLLFYLYGVINEPDSLVLSEDDFLNFFEAVTLKNPLPINILSELQSRSKSLLFLGFDFRQWYLRILLHVLLGRVSEKERSFALEQFTPSDAEELQRMIFFYEESKYNIHICNKELRNFVKELSERYEEQSKGAEKRSLSSTPRVQLQDVPTIFICHASEDAVYAAKLYEQLEEAGFRPWLDKQKLRGGDAWDQHIKNTIKEIDYFVVLQSQSLAQKHVSYVNKEINIALDRKLEFRRGTRFIIPVIIEECPLLEDLEDIQSINLVHKETIEELISTIKRDYQRRKR